MKTQDRLSKVALARELHISRTKLAGYLSRDDAPAADSSGLFDLADVREYVGANSGGELGERLQRDADLQLWKAAVVLGALRAERSRILRALPRIAKKAGLLPAQSTALAEALEESFDRA